MTDLERPIIAKQEVTRHILKSFNIRAAKKLGQNFLIDPQVVEDIAKAAILSPMEKILEIGPGIGTLTQGLLEAGGDVIAVELDSRLIPILAQTLTGYEHLRVVHGDILKTDIPALMGEGTFAVAANLPYYITTPILMGLLEAQLPISRMVTMVQKEVALRMVAKPGGKDYGALSVAIQYWTEPEIIRYVSKDSFVPAPEVESAVVRCTLREKPPVDVDRKMFFRTVKAAFGQRRKVLGNALKGGGFLAEDIQEAFKVTGIDPQRRGETLSLEEFAALAQVFYNIK